MIQFLKKIWMRLLLRKAHYQDDHSRLEKLYQVNDPWNMSSPREAFRFKETNRIIAQRLGRIDALLEIGSGEGHQSAYFQNLVKKVTGIDVSEKAVNRAKLRCPQSEFICSDLYSYHLAPDQNKFDLVVACETLYYLSDINKAIQKMNSLGQKCLVSYFVAEFKNLDAYFTSLPHVQFELITFEDLCWKLVWWENQ